jgi:hypothetical protein
MIVGIVDMTAESAPKVLEEAAKGLKLI